MTWLPAYWLTIVEFIAVVVAPLALYFYVAYHWTHPKKEDT